MYTLKLNSDGFLARLKACLVVKGYSQVFGFDYQDTFFSVAKLTSLQIFIFLAATCQWPLHQLYVKNAFLNDVLVEEV